MRKFLIFFVVLAVGLGGLYIWWQRNSARIIEAQVQKIASGFFVSPGKLTVKSDPVKMTGLRQARVPKIVISGTNLQVKDGPKLSSAKLVLKDVDIAGPPFAMKKLGGGDFVVSMTDAAVTDYLRKRGIKVAPLINFPADTLTVKFAKAESKIDGAFVVPLVNAKVPVSAYGKLMPASKNGQVDLKIDNIKVGPLPFRQDQIKQTLQAVNPIVDISGWPVEVEFDKITTGDGFVTARGRFTGVTASLLPW